MIKFKKLLLASIFLLSVNLAFAGNIDVIVDKNSQTMTVVVDNQPTYNWKVSTGRPGYDTPSGNFQASSMNELWISKQWDNAPMPHAIFFTKKGHAIHGTLEVRSLGRAVSHGCVRLSNENATKLYQLVTDNGLESTHVTINGGGGDVEVQREEQQPIPVKPPRHRLPPPPPPRYYYEPPQYYQPPPHVPRILDLFWGPPRYY